MITKELYVTIFVWFYECMLSVAIVTALKRYHQRISGECLSFSTRQVEAVDLCISIQDQSGLRDEILSQNKAKQNKN